MNQYPIVLIPQAISEAKNSLPPLPHKPSEPFLPRKEKNGSFGCLFPVVIFVVFLAIIHKQEIIIPCIILSLIVIIIIYFREEKSLKRKYQESVEKYNTYQQTYQKKIIEWEEETNRIKNDQILIKEFRDRAISDLFSRTVKPSRFLISQKGFSEHDFHLVLNKYFGSNILINKVIDDTRFDIPYQPDFIYYDNKTNLHIDIEVDEPYTFDKGIPIHYFSNGSSIDHFRDNYFLNANWIVIRFCEEQVVKYSAECCKLIASTIDKLIGFRDFTKVFAGIGIIPQIPHWTYEESIELYKQNHRLLLIAETTCKKSEENRREKVKKLRNSGIEYYEQKNYPKAIELFNKALRFNEEEQDIGIYFQRAICYRLINELGKSKEDLSYIIRIDGANHRAYNQMGLCLKSEGKYEEAIYNYSQAINITDKSIYYKNRALCYRLTEKYELALADYSKFLETNPHDDSILYQRGVINLELGNIESAIKDFSSANEISPNTEDYLNFRGIAYLLCQDIERSSIDFNSVIDLNVNSYLANYGLDFIENTFFKNICFVPKSINNKNFITINNLYNNSTMKLTDFFQKSPFLEKWNQMNEFWKNYFRTELGFRGTPNERVLNEIFATKSIELNMKGISDISIVALLPYLESLTLGWNPITDLTPLKACLNLKSLILSGTKVSDISPIKGLKNLEEIHLMQAPISEIDSFRELYNLEHIIISGTEVSSLEPLKNLKKLKTLNIENTKVSDLRPLYELKNLKELWGDYIQIDEEDIEDEIAKLLSHLPELELMHSDDETAPLDFEMGENGEIIIDQQQFDSATNDPEKYNEDYKRYLKLMEDIRDGIVSEEILNTDPSKRSLTSDDLKLIFNAGLN